ncbi:hypothetical protein GCM10009733_023700 [Nonomuraea maheshkhaliensis]|uniref:Uncharacterized protein n=1 Tax=Nonomuraea maheshkhaliensis TaxID=419590 RepID=A0ABP4R156_9ACTN
MRRPSKPSSSSKGGDSITPEPYCRDPIPLGQTLGQRSAMAPAISRAIDGAHQLTSSAGDINLDVHAADPLPALNRADR